MRPFLLAATTGYLIFASVALAADKTVHDKDNGFSLSYPEGWTREPTSGDTIRLKVKSGDRGLTCRVSANLYDPSAPDSPAVPRTFIEKDWSSKEWSDTIGAGFPSAVFSNERLIRFPDGYPARLADMDFRISDSNFTFYGHAKVAISLRGARYGFVTCGIMADSAEQTARMWAPLADEAEKVVNSFVLDAP